jgi:phosphoribosyl-ATP pyrophosphohydrolase/phosphoribosyl-AMP cyclohydrolase
VSQRDSERVLESLRFARDGLVTCVTQDAVTGAVLMVAHMNSPAAARTVESAEMHYLSRSRGLWRKGETSGNVQRLVSLAADCDGDAVLARVRPAGPACHNGTVSCFEGATGDALSALADVVKGRTEGYTGHLLADRNLRLKKVAEEAGEFVVACADHDRVRATEEAADLLYHVIVALEGTGVTLDEVRAVLAARSR